MSSASQGGGEVEGAGWHRCWGLGEGQGRKWKQNVCVICEMLSRRCRYSVCKTDGSSFLSALKRVQLCTVRYMRASVASVNRNGYDSVCAALPMIINTPCMSGSIRVDNVHSNRQTLRSSLSCRIKSNTLKTTTLRQHPGLCCSSKRKHFSLSHTARNYEVVPHSTSTVNG